MKCIGFFLTAAWLFCGAAALAAAPNVVLFVGDDLGRHFGCYGDPVAQTPRLDSLASEGTRFDLAFCTTASCSASRSVILTGLHNHANGQYGHQHAEHNFSTFARVQSLPVLLAQAGYRTALAGKFHVQPEETYHFETTVRGVNPRNGVEMAEKCKDFIAAEDERPFFLYFCPTDPHRARQGFANDVEYPGVTPVPYDWKTVPVPTFLPDDPVVRMDLAEYYQSVSRLDQGLGRLIDVLKETGKWDNTIFIFTSDNGMPFPGAKTTLYEPGVRLPLVVRAPGQMKPGNVSQAMVSWVDLAPTILDIARQATAGEGNEQKERQLRQAMSRMQGRSFLGVLDEEMPEGWDEVFASHTFHEVTNYYPMRVIRTRQHKLILNVAHQLPFPFASDLYGCPTWQMVLERGLTNFGPRDMEAFLLRPRYELYDIERDPDELYNQADNPSYAELLSELQQKLGRWQQETRDPWIVKYIHE
jgi:N-sulfoglucosamine sulfohydrolase